MTSERRVPKNRHERAGVAGAKSRGSHWFECACRRPEGVDTGCIVNGRVLKAAHSAAVLGLQVQEFNANLDVMTGNLLFVAGVLHSGGFGILRPPFEPVTERHPRTRAEEIWMPWYLISGCR